MSQQFYITLPSDSSMEYYPDNTVAIFTTKLSEEVELNGDYKVRLAEILYQQSWYIINNTKGDLLGWYRRRQ